MPRVQQNLLADHSNHALAPYVSSIQLRWRPLPRALARDHGRQRQPDDLQVAGERVVVHVLDVILHRLVVGEVGAAVDLGEAGDAGLHVVAAVVLGRVLLHQLRDLRPRADDAHVALQHVPEVRQLVQARRAQEAADARQPRHRRGEDERLEVDVLELRRLVGLVPLVRHRAVLVHGEALAPQPHARLRVDHRPARIELDGERDQRIRDHEDHRAGDGGGNVEEPAQHVPMSGDPARSPRPPWRRGRQQRRSCAYRAEATPSSRTRGPPRGKSPGAQPYVSR